MDVRNLNGSITECESKLRKDAIGMVAIIIVAVVVVVVVVAGFLFPTYWPNNISLLSHR